MIFTLFLSFFFMQMTQAQTLRVFTDEICEDYSRIAQEFIDAELAGARWQGSDGTPFCLKNLEVKTFNPDHTIAGDPNLLDPEFILPEPRKVDFAVKQLPNDLMEVVIHYIGKKNKKDIPVKDRFLLRLNFGKTREIRGCASLFSEPVHLVMRAKCWKD